MQNSAIDKHHDPQIFRASGFWKSNVWGAVVAGIGTGLLMSTVACILIWQAQSFRGKLFGIVWVLFVAVTFLAMFPGNLLATYPIAVELEDGEGLRLEAPLKKLYIPLEQIDNIRDSTLTKITQGGVIVVLNKRRGLIKKFIIHWTFGAEGKQLAYAIREQISRPEE